MSFSKELYKHIIFLNRPTKGPKRRSYFVHISSKHDNRWEDIAEREKDADEIRRLIIERDKNLLESIEKSEYNAENFLLTVNAGGALALAGLIQRYDDLRSSTFVIISFALFAVSIVLIGMIKALRIKRNYFFRGEWRKNSNSFFKNAISIEQLLERDSTLWNYPKTMIVFAWGAFLAFGSSVILLIWQFAISI